MGKMTQKTWHVLFYLTQGILLLVFLLEGSTKILGLSFQTEGFARWGYPLWFMYLVGTLEILGAIGLTTQYRTWAALGLVGIMLGAIYTHIASGEAPMSGLAILMLALLWISIRLKKRLL